MTKRTMPTILFGVLILSLGAVFLFSCNAETTGSDSTKPAETQKFNKIADLTQPYYGEEVLGQNAQLVEEAKDEEPQNTEGQKAESNEQPEAITGPVSTNPTASQKVNEEQPDADEPENKPEEQYYGLIKHDISELSEEQIQKIKIDYVEYLKATDNQYYHIIHDPEYTKDMFTVDDVLVLGYYGTYNGAELLEVEFRGYRKLQILTRREIAGFNIVFPHSGIFILHKGSSFMYLWDAYTSGIITELDVRDMLQPINGLY